MPLFPESPHRPNDHKWRRLFFAAGFLAPALLAFGVAPAMAQGISILRDTETEEMLRSYETPLARAAGLDPGAVNLYLVGDNSVNAFVAEGQNLFMMTGMIMFAKNANELIGVMAHETGHIKAGHIIRGGDAASKTMIPMLLSMIVGLAAMAAGAGEGGTAIIGAGAAMAEAQMNAFTRVQEGTADQIALQLLTATHQSANGLYNTFARFAAEEAQSAYKIDKYAVDHPIGQERLGFIEEKVANSTYKDVKDPPQVTHTFEMVQAKLAGYVLPVDQGLARYPVSNTSEAARYARAMLYLRKPDLAKALAEINSLIAEEPSNPYFQEVLGQIYVTMAKPHQAIPAYQKAVNLKPGAPQLRLGLAVALLATDEPSLAGQALQNLKAASLAENDDVFTWYETAQAYSILKNEPMANLSTAELYYNTGAMAKAVIFATRARRGLTEGTADWQRAGDIIGVATAAARQR